MELLNYICSKYFFKKYCPAVKSWKHKQRGFNGRGNPTWFTKEDIKLIDAGLTKMHADFSKAAGIHGN